MKVPEVIYISNISRIYDNHVNCIKNENRRNYENYRNSQIADQILRHHKNIQIKNYENYNSLILQSRKE